MATMSDISLLNKLRLYISPKTIYRSEDGHIVIKDSVENKRPVRVLYVDNIRESGIYLDEGMDSDPLFFYMQSLKEVALYYEGLDKALLIGGGGMAFTKYYINSIPKGHIDVVEKDSRFVELAGKYFFYTDDERVKINIADGAGFISKSATANASIINGKGLKQYDFIIFDAFNGNRPPKELFSEGVLKLTRQIMGSDAILAMNMLNEKPGVVSMQTHLTQAVLKNIFKNTKIINCQMGWNCILLASDREL
ncbi:MAG: hypothetical protein J6N21_00680 [Butyrivibrio sp.]|nr:hypothetical protein [Butyrivibrio sp.]